EFRESARGEVTAVVHLEVPGLRVHVGRGVERVGGVVTVEVGNPVFVSDHLYTGAQASEVDVPRVTGKRAAQGRKNGNGAHDEKNDEGRGDPQGNATHNTRLAHALRLPTFTNRRRIINCAYLFLCLCRLRAQVRHLSVLLRGLVNHLLGMPGTVAEGIQLRRSSVQGIRVLPHRLSRGEPRAEQAGEALLR